MPFPSAAPDLRRLRAPHREPCISVYLPTAAALPQKLQTPLVYRKLLKEVAASLERRGVPDPAALLRPLQELDTTSFWLDQGEGLAVFGSPDHFSHVRLPAAVPELAMVGPRFHTRPLAAMFSDSNRYHVLAVAQERVAVFEGWREFVQEQAVPDLPARLAEVAPEADLDRHQFRFHSVRPGSGESVYHSTGESRPAIESELRKFFKAIDKRLCRQFQGSRRPLVLAAQDRYQTLYREISQLSNLLPAEVRCDAGNLDLADLGRKAWRAVEAQHHAQLRRLFESYQEARSKGRGGCDLQEVARRAASGQVETLIVDPRREIWGIVDRDSGEIREWVGGKANGKSELLETLSDLVLDRNGQVYFAEEEAVPLQTGLAAIYRY
jgi:hypothetical protein